jgi:hypothetical protein
MQHFIPHNKTKDYYPSRLFILLLRILVNNLKCNKYE